MNINLKLVYPIRSKSLTFYFCPDSKNW